MINISFVNALPVIVALLLTACSGDSNNNATETSEFNPDLDSSVNTGSPGGDITPIAGLWDGTTTAGNASDVVYWNFAANGVLTRYDYQQDGGTTASGENCYIASDPVTVTPEGDNDYSIFDVAVTATVSGESLSVTFLEADKNDLDADGDTDETPVFTWTKLLSPVLEDLNSCENTNSETAPSTTFFKGSIDGQAMNGGGITLLGQDDSSFLIRGLWGTPNDYYQIDIQIPGTADGTYQPGANGATGSVSEIIGQDAVGATYNASGGDSDTVAFIWDQDAGRVVGDFAFTAVGGDSGLIVSGEFNISVSGSNAWSCNFEDAVISRCWSIE